MSRPPRFGSRKFSRSGSFIPQEVFPERKIIAFNDFSGGFKPSRDRKIIEPNASPLSRNMEVRNDGRLQRVPGTKLIRQFGERTPIRLALHPGLNEAVQLALVAPPEIGFVSADPDRAVDWTDIGMSSRRFASTTFGGSFIFTDGLKVWGRTHHSSIIRELGDAPVGESYASFGGRVFAAPTIIDGRWEPLGVRWSAANGNYKDWSGFGSGFELLVNDVSTGDKIQSLVPMSLDFLAVMMRQSIWVGPFTGDVLRPADFASRVSGVGAVNSRVSRLSRFGIIFLSDFGVYVFDGNSANLISDDINSELLPLDYGNLDSYHAVYDPMRKRYILSTPNKGTWVLDIERGRWHHRTFASADSVLFPSQIDAVRWFEILGDWTAQTEVWADLAADNIGDLSLLMLGDQELGGESERVLSVESMLRATFFGKQFSPYWETNFSMEQDASFFNTIKEQLIEYEGGGSLRLWLPDEDGHYVPTLVADLFERNYPSYAVFNAERVSMGIGIGVEILIEGNEDPIGIPENPNPSGDPVEPPDEPDEPGEPLPEPQIMVNPRLAMESSLSISGLEIIGIGDLQNQTVHYIETGSAAVGGSLRRATAAITPDENYAFIGTYSTGQHGSSSDKVQTLDITDPTNPIELEQRRWDLDITNNGGDWGNLGVGGPALVSVFYDKLTDRVLAIQGTDSSVSGSGTRAHLIVYDWSNRAALSVLSVIQLPDVRAFKQPVSFESNGKTFYSEGFTQAENAPCVVRHTLSADGLSLESHTIFLDPLLSWGGGTTFRPGPVYNEATSRLWLIGPQVNTTGDRRDWIVEIDWSNPVSPVVLGLHEFGVWTGSNVEYEFRAGVASPDGDFLYVNSRLNGSSVETATFLVFNVSVPGSPQIVGQLSDANLMPTESSGLLRHHLSLTPNGKHVILTNGSVVNVEDPANPTLVNAGSNRIGRSGGVIYGHSTNPIGVPVEEEPPATPADVLVLGTGGNTSKHAIYVGVNEPETLTDLEVLSFVNYNADSFPLVRRIDGNGNIAIADDNHGGIRLVGPITDNLREIEVKAHGTFGTQGKRSIGMLNGKLVVHQANDRRIRAFDVSAATLNALANGDSWPSFMATGGTFFPEGAIIDSRRGDRLIERSGLRLFSMNSNNVTGGILPLGMTMGTGIHGFQIVGSRLWFVGATTGGSFRGWLANSPVANFGEGGGIAIPNRLASDAAIGTTHAFVAASATGFSGKTAIVSVSIADPDAMSIVQTFIEFGTTRTIILIGNELWVVGANTLDGNPNPSVYRVNVTNPAAMTIVESATLGSYFRADGHGTMLGAVRDDSPSSIVDFINMSAVPAVSGSWDASALAESPSRIRGIKLIESGGVVYAVMTLSPINVGDSPSVIVVNTATQAVVGRTPLDETGLQNGTFHINAKGAFNSTTNHLAIGTQSPSGGGQALAIIDLTTLSTPTVAALETLDESSRDYSNIAFAPGPFAYGDGILVGAKWNGEKGLQVLDTSALPALSILTNKTRIEGISSTFVGPTTALVWQRGIGAGNQIPEKVFWIDTSNTASMKILAEQTIVPKSFLSSAPSVGRMIFDGANQRLYVWRRLNLAEFSGGRGVLECWEVDDFTLTKLGDTRALGETVAISGGQEDRMMIQPNHRVVTRTALTSSGGFFMFQILDFSTPATPTIEKVYRSNESPFDEFTFTKAVRDMERL